MKGFTSLNRRRNIIMAGACLAGGAALAFPQNSTATVIFNDTFPSGTSSQVDPATYPTPTSSSTGYDVFSTKTSTSILALLMAQPLRSLDNERTFMPCQPIPYEQYAPRIQKPFRLGLLSRRILRCITQFPQMAKSCLTDQKS